MHHEFVIAADLVRLINGVWPRILPITVLALGAAGVLSGVSPTLTGPKIVVGNNVSVSATAPNAQFIEPYVVADPKDSRHLIAASATTANPNHAYSIAAFCSFDSGATWTRSNLDALDRLTFRLALDIWLAFGPDGTAYLSVLVTRQTTEVLIFRSTDGGRSWTRLGTVPRRGRDSFDRPSIVADATSGHFSGSIYVLSEESFSDEEGIGQYMPTISRSTDRGVSFSEPLRIQTGPGTGGMPIGSVVLPDGTVILAFFSFASDAGPGGPRHIWVARSIDGCKTVSTNQSVAEIAFPEPDSYPQAAPNVMLAADVGSAHFKDRIYLVWSDSRAGATDLYVAYSTDKGQRWSDPVKVNDNSNPRVDQATPVLAVNRHGVVGVAWQDRRDDPTNQCSTVYFSASLDGGRSFLPNVKVGSARSCTGPEQGLPPATRRTIARWRVGGDYMGISASPDGAFHLVWSDARTAYYQLWSAAVRIEQN